MRDGFGRGFAVGLLLVAGAALGQAAGNPGQAATSRLAFVSATVKPAAHPTLGKNPSMSVDASHAYYYLSLKQLIMVAYKVTSDQVSGPAWLESHLYDIVATLPAGASKDDLPAMLQTLLKDRFKLVFHVESKNQQVMALVVAKGGPKLQTATPGQPDGMTMEEFAAQLTKLVPQGGAPTFTGGSSDRVYSTYGYGDPGLDSTEYRGDWKVIVDQTGLTGKYLLPAPSYKDGPESVLFASVRKYGLKLQLDTRKVVKSLVVDHAEKMPTAN
jgi:uncharacterized protein (TIGR03435 family)